MKHISRFLMLALVVSASSALADCGSCHREPRAPRAHCSSCHHEPRKHCSTCHKHVSHCSTCHRKKGDSGPVDAVTAPVVGTADAVLGSPWYYDQD